MGCCGDKPRSVRDSKVAPEFALRRMAKCGVCEHNVRGVCTLVKELQADRGNIKDGLVEIGVLMPDAWCPVGKWGVHRKTPLLPGDRPMCFWCGRYHDNLENEICHWCRNRLAMQHRNAIKGIGANALGSPRDTRLHEIRYRPFTEPTTRHLHFFLYPKFANSVRYHIDQLYKAADIFNGKRAVCVATDSSTCEADFRSAIEDLFTDIQYIENDPNRRETAGFIETLKAVLSDSENEAICFAHGKGQQMHTQNSEMIRKWCDAAYETCVTNWAAVKNAMEEGYPIAGSFKSVGAFKTTAYKWHYSGAFWWARSRAILENENWEQLCNKWWGTESYVGRHWWPDEGYCLFGDHTGGGSLYDKQTWVRLDMELERWRSDSLKQTA